MSEGFGIFASAPSLRWFFSAIVSFSKQYSNSISPFLSSETHIQSPAYSSHSYFSYLVIIVMNVILMMNTSFRPRWFTTGIFQNIKVHRKFFQLKIGLEKKYLKT